MNRCNLSLEPYSSITSVIQNWCCCYTNLDSLLAKFDELVAIVHFYKPNVVAVSETWLNDSHSDSLVNIPGYKIYRHDRVHSRGGGVCIYLNNNIFLQYTVDIIPNALRGTECLFLLITFKSFIFVFGCIYRPSSTSFENDQELFIFLTDLFQKYDNIVITGDFNFSEISWPLSYDLHVPASCLPLIDFLSNTHAVQIVEEFTRFRSGQNPSLLDLIFVSNDNLATDLQYLPPIGKSDHALLTFNVQSGINVMPKRTIVRKTFLDFNKINKLLAEIDWKTKLTSNAVEENWQTFCATLLSLQMECSNYKTYISNPSKPWINSNIFNLIKRKKAMWQKYRRTKLAEDYISHRIFSNTLIKEIKKARNNYEESIVSSENPKVVFKYIKRALSSVTKELRLNRPDNSKTMSDNETANLLAKFFSESYNNISHKPPLPIKSHTDGTLSDITFEINMIAKKLELIKPTSCPGPDMISPAVFKHCSQLLAIPLHIIMDQSYKMSILPNDWKIALIRPIYKSGNRFDVKNYRPISLTSPVVKIMESIIVDQLDLYLQKYELIPRQQFGFLKGRSVEQNLLTCINDWSKALDNSETVDVVYLDFSKAFDKVPLKLLLMKLNSYGISGNLLRWIECFLSNRKFFVRVGNGFSDIFDVLSGVPQGSVLGPKLFLLYTADIPKSITSSCAMYADDIKVYNHISNASVLQNDINVIFDWGQQWGIPLNKSKCKVLRIGKDKSNINYQIQGECLSRVTEHNDLGVQIHRNLTWTNHIIKQVKKANLRMYTLYKTFSKKNISLMAKIFKTYVRPILEFANVVWYPNRIQDLETYEKVQRKFTRWCFGARRPNYNTRLKHMKLITLSDRRLRGDLIHTFKILKLGKEGHQIFQIRGSQRLRGHSLSLSVPKFKTDIMKNFFPVRVIKSWNRLPTEIIDVENVNLFKNRIDEFFQW